MPEQARIKQLKIWSTYDAKQRILPFERPVRYTHDCSIHMTHEMSFMREHKTGQYVHIDDYLKLFQTCLLIIDLVEYRSQQVTNLLSDPAYYKGL